MPTYNPFQSSASRFNTAGQSVLGGLTRLQPGQFGTGVQNYLNPYQNQIIQQQMDEIERQRLHRMNQIGSQAASAGAFGGSRHGIVEGMANRDYAKMLNDTTSRMRHQGWQSAVQNRNQDLSSLFGAANQLAGLGQTEFGIGQQLNRDLMQQGQMQRQLNQQLLDLARGQFGQYMQTPQQRMGLLSSLIHGTAPLEQSRNRSGGSNTLGKAANIIGSVASIASAFSDVRLKNDIQLAICCTIKGHDVNLYTWEWNDKAIDLGIDPNTPTFGFVAQELQSALPEYVSEDRSGYLMVDYGKIARDIGRRMQ